MCTYNNFDLNVDIPLRQEALMVDDSSSWVLDITDVYYNITLVGKDRMCTNLQNDIMVILCDVITCVQFRNLAIMLEVLPIIPSRTTQKFLA